MNCVNLGGEGEVPGVLNQQPEWVRASSSWRSQSRKTIDELLAQGHTFLFCSNDQLAIDDESMDIVYTNNVQIGGSNHLGPWVPISEIERVLKHGGLW